MLHFVNDYSEGCTPEILEALLRTNMEQLPGYGLDRYTSSAIEKIRQATGLADAEVYLLNGGTMTNQLVIDTMLTQYEGVIAAQTGHINVHEAGAIEFTGHKVLPVPQYDGKLKAGDVRAYLETFFGDANHEHMVFPGMVYISHPTEYGTLYSLSELEELSSLCREYRIPLYLDGARLAYGLTAKGADVTLRDIARLTDVFYIGGTKCGALCGEALVFTRHNCPAHFVTRIKLHGDLNAKGRLNGIQFDTLFTDDLYLRLGQRANRAAERLRQVFSERGYRFFLDSPTNQQFFIIQDDLLRRIAQEARYDFWERYDATHTVVRFATSWATRDEDITRLATLLDELA